MGVGKNIKNYTEEKLVFIVGGVVINTIRNYMKRKIKKEDREWAKKVKEFWGNKCAITGCDNKERLNAHHLIPYEIKKYRYDLGNGICLCPSHHRFSFKLSAHQNSLAFWVWMEETYPTWTEKLKEKIKQI